MSNDVRVQVPSLAPFPFSAEVNTACGCGGMADALASGASVRKDVGVQVPPHPHQVKELKSFDFSSFSVLFAVFGFMM